MFDIIDSGIVERSAVTDFGTINPRRVDSHNRSSLIKNWRTLYIYFFLLLSTVRLIINKYKPECFPVFSNDCIFLHLNTLNKCNCKLILNVLWLSTYNFENVLDGWACGSVDNVVIFPAAEWDQWSKKRDCGHNIRYEESISNVLFYESQYSYSEKAPNINTPVVGVEELPDRVFAFSPNLLGSKRRNIRSQASYSTADQDHNNVDTNWARISFIGAISGASEKLEPVNGKQSQ